jgi:hypothetical protein
VGRETNVLDHPVEGAGKDRQQEKARKKQAEQDSRDKNKGMDAEPPNGILHLSQ